MSVWLVVLLFVAQPVPAGGSAARPAASSTVTPEHRAEAYYQFVLGRQLEGEGDVDGAVAAFRRAVALDPQSAEVQAELAGLFARQNRAPEAITAAEAALLLDPGNAEAHWVLGSVYAALAQGTTDGPPTAAAALDKAIFHLEKARPDRRFDYGLVLGLGRLYLRKKDFPKAVEQLKWLSDQEPGAAEVAFMLAQAYDGSGRRRDAIDTLQRVVGMEPRFFRGWVLLGELLEQERRYGEAAEAYGQAVAQNSKNTELRLRHATALLNAGQPAAGRTALRQLAQDSPTDANVLYLLAEAERAMKDYDAAETAAKRLVALEPQQLRGAYALALVHEARREHGKVVSTLEPAVTGTAAETLPGRALAPVLLKLGLAYQELGDFPRAVATFEKARSMGGADPVFDAYLGQALTAAGEPARALAVLESARQQHPDDFRLTRLQADALVKRGDVDGAVALLQQETARRAAEPDAHLALAGLCAEAERFDCADRALAQAEKQFPNNPDVLFQRGALLEQQERYDDAERTFRAVLARDPLHGPALNYLGYMFAERGVHLDEAVSLLERALETDPWNGSYFDSLGWAHFGRGDLEKARTYLSLAAERLPRNSVVQDHLGDLLWKQGDRAGALAAWERALAGDRDSIEPATIARKVEDARRVKP